MIMKNRYQHARFLLSSPDSAHAPEDSGLEVAFAGRSNAGKSSALNVITGQKALARTSKTPGRTQQIVIFELDERRRIADLPGYGYAKVPTKLKHHWRAVMERYFQTRRSLHGVVLVMDIRHPMREFDQQLLAWCAMADIPCHVLLTKADKLKRGPARSTLLQVRRNLPDGASAQVFSSHNKTGLDELIDKLSGWYEYEDKES